MTYESLSLFDAPRVAPQLAIRGDLSGAVQAFVDPDQLSPAQREEWFSDDDTAFGKILKAVANPLVVAGAIISMAFPVPTARGLLGFAEKLKGLEKSVNPYGRPLLPGFHKLQSAISIFGGTRFYEYMRGVLRDLRDFKAVSNLPLAEAAARYERETGKALKFREQIAAFHHLDGLTNYKHPVWQLIRARERDRLYNLKYGDRSPDLVDDAIEAYVTRIGLVTNPSKLDTPAYLIEAARESLIDAWKRFATPENLDRMAARDLKRLRRDFNHQMEALGVRLGVNPTKTMTNQQFFEAVIKAFKEKNYKFVADYAPHIEARTTSQMQDAFQAMLNRTAESSHDAFTARILSEANMSPGTQHLVQRLNAMLPDPRDFEAVADAYSPETLAVLREYVQPGRFRGYSQRLLPVMSHYAHSMGRAYAWTARGWGQKLLDEYEVLKVEDKQGIKKNLAANVYLPALMGKLDPYETVQALAWGDLKYRAWNFFKQDNVRKVLGEKTADALVRFLESDTIQNLTFKNAGAKIAGLFYLNTLGLNPASAGLNVMQNLMTTSAVVEPKYLVAGIREASKDIARLAEVYSKGNKTIQEAFEEAIPHYFKYIGEASEVEAMTAFRRAMVGGQGASKLETVKSAMMSMFTATERFNKLWAYHAGRIKGMAEGAASGLKGRALEEFSTEVGRRVMEITQFPGGVLGTASGLIGVWPPLRQFTQFPLRTLELAGPLGGQLGAAEKALPDWVPVLGGRSPGTLGRMLMASGLVYGVGKAAGLDLSKGLMFGAMPTPENPDSPFYPWPLVPPILNLPGAIASDLFAGEWDQVPRAIPSLVPGGVALARASSVVAPGLAAALGRQYADYSQRTPDGRIAIYTADGALKGYKSPMELFAQAVGWQTLTGDPEAEITQYLVKQRDKIRAIRRDYIEAIARNDLAEQERIEKYWKYAYPQLGDIVVKPSDIRAVHLRHDVSRIERVLETMPEESRALFGPMIGVALGDAAEQFLGVDPMLLSSGTIGQRDPHRAVTSPYTLNLRENLKEDKFNFRPDQAGQKPNRGLTPFESFDGF